MPTATPNPSVQGQRARRLIDRFFVRAQVVEVAPVASRMRRIRLAGPALSDLSWVPGQQVRLMVRDPFAFQSVRSGFRDVLRTYSVWQRDPDSGALDLCVLDHGDGPGAAWSRQVTEGDDVAFSGPEGKFVLRDAAHHVFVGEETAQVAFGAILRALPDDAIVHGVIEVGQAGDRLDVPRAPELSWCDRNGAAAAGSQTLLDAVRSLRLPDAPGHLYLAGESTTCAAIRRHFAEERHWPARTAISVKPFWTPGKRGLE
jgi:NADPH-dependent ferric siderophore reductase